MKLNCWVLRSSSREAGDVVGRTSPGEVGFYGLGGAGAEATARRLQGEALSVTAFAPDERR